jgi:uncharacterized protein (DUF302 family)
LTQDVALYAVQPPLDQVDHGVAVPTDPTVHNDDIITKRSPWSIADTVARLSAVVAARGMEVFAVIDYSSKAREPGLELRDTKLVIFGSPSAMTAVIAAAPLAALDLPLRVVVWEDGYQTLVSYPPPAAVVRRYGLDGDLAAALASIDALTSAVINR